ERRQKPSMPFTYPCFKRLRVRRFPECKRCGTCLLPNIRLQIRLRRRTLRTHHSSKSSYKMALSMVCMPPAVNRQMKLHSNSDVRFTAESRHVQITSLRRLKTALTD